MRKKSSKILGAACASVLVLASGIIIAVTQVPQTIQPGVKVGSIDVGGLSPTSAEKQIRTWWQTKKIQPLKLVWKGHNIQFPSLTPQQLGVTVGDVQTVQSLPVVTLVAAASGLVTHSKSKNQTFPIQFKSNGEDITPAIIQIKNCLPKPRNAIVHFVKGKGLFKKPEIPALTIDRPLLESRVIQALQDDRPVQLPIEQGKVTVTEEDLDSITDLIGSYTTYFPAHQTSRDTNIRLASGMLNGVVLMPGEEMSFNKTVGKRTAQKGYRTATVFVDGHDGTGIGGGICQVSTTLYNASLLSDLDIVSRQNHSMPVGYIPLGRDATVDWGEIDLVVKNPYSFPIAITSEYHPGSLTFRVFGKPQNGLVVRIERTGFKSIRPDTETEIDSKLPPGKTVVIDDGMRGREVHTFRLVYLNGKLISKESLGWSIYKSKPRIVEKGPAVSPLTSTPAPSINRGPGP